VNLLQISAIDLQISVFAFQISVILFQIFADICKKIKDIYNQWCIAKNGGGYTQRGVAKGLKVPCLFMIAEVSIRSQKNPAGWYTPYTRVYPPIHHCLQLIADIYKCGLNVKTAFHRKRQIEALEKGLAVVARNPKTAG